METLEVCKRPLKICLLNNDYSKSNSALKGTDPPSDPRHYLPKDLPWKWHEAFIDKSTSFSQINKLRRQKFDLYLNFCDGSMDEDRAGADVIDALEYFKLPYTGCDKKFFNLTKKCQKLAATSTRINTPKYYFAYNDDDIEVAVKHLNIYPLIVKHHNSYSSIAMTKKNKVYDKEALREQARIMIEDYGGALIEEFIEGKEYTLLIFENPQNKNEPLVLNPVEFVFKNGETFKHFELKNINFNDMETKFVEDAELSKKLKQMAKEAFIYMYGTSYGRIDVRVNDRGEIFFLEVNAMPKIFCPVDEMSSADLIMMHEKTHTAEKMAYLIMQTALETHRMKQIPFHVSFRNLYGGSGIFATRNIKKGELIYSEEEKPKYIVSKKHGESLKGMMGEWFRNYAYTLSDQIFATWSDNPEDWMPLNHSCNPNMWYEGDFLNVVAARDIEKEEELTMDYCTFLAETELAFDCQCGEKCCRGKFTGKDYLIKEMQEKYAGHFAVYVKQRFDKLEGSS